MMAKLQVRRIREWRPCFGKSSNVMLQGYIEGDDTKKLWRSSVIEYREDARTLATKGGGTYILVGSINKKACIERGFSMEIIEMFLDGFPENWRDLLLSQYNNLTHNLATFTTTTRHDIDHDFDHFTPPKPKNKKPTKAVVPYKTTPNTVATTRSGRVVKPRTATWANQSIVYDKDGSIIEVRNPITTTRQSKKVNQNLDKLCDALGVDTPEASQISEKSINTPPKRKSEESKIKKKKPKNLVGYSDSEDEYDSINELSSDGLELPETGDTPIRPSKRNVKKLQKKIQKVFESSSEDEEKEEVPIKVEKLVRKKRAAPKAIKDAPAAKKGKKNEPLSKGLSLKKARERTVTPDLVDFDDHPVVEFPESDKENDAAPKKWTSKEKERFLDLLKIMNPVNDFDWERFQLNNKSDRTIEEMKAKAKELKWKPSQTRTHEETVNPIAEITAKPGTAARIMQANQVNHNYLAAKNRNAATDGFAQQIRDANYAPLHLDDSVISMIRTPENPKRQRNAFNPTMEINLDGSLNESSLLSPSSLSSPSFIIPQNEESRRRQQRNGLNILKKTYTTTRRHGQNSTVFTDTITATMNFIVPPIPKHRQSRLSGLEEEANSEDDDEEEEEDENEISMGDY